jgi:hypothetical protein
MPQPSSGRRQRAPAVFGSGKYLSAPTSVPRRSLPKAHAAGQPFDWGARHHTDDLLCAPGATRHHTDDLLCAPGATRFRLPTCRQSPEPTFFRQRGFNANHQMLAMVPAAATAAATDLVVFDGLTPPTIPARAGLR